MAVLPARLAELVCNLWWGLFPLPSRLLAQNLDVLRTIAHALGMRGVHNCNHVPA